MKHVNKQRQILSDALADAGPVDFRATLLRDTMCVVARRHRHRRRARIALGAAGVICALVLFFSLRPRAVNLAPAAVAASLPPPHWIVITATLPPPALVNTELQGVTLVATTADTVFLVSTKSSLPPVKLLGDADLLALAGPGAALVGAAGAERTLLLPADTPN